MLAMAVVLSAAGCHQSQGQVPANADQTNAQDGASDPSMVNLAPVSNDPNAQASAAYQGPGNGQEPAAPDYRQNAPPPDNGGNYQTPEQPYDQGSDDPGYGQQPVSYAPEPPPPLPEYDQPEAPGDDYLWTPGYWAWGDGGYYWVPGVWVEAPYEGALWTPGYWGFWNNRYGFYQGYWGPHIGYYGGVDYGFGYFGFGYQGGYWGGGHFNYNRSVNNVRGGRVHNVYDRSVGGNHRGGGVSFNGGRGGMQVRARPAELAARHDQHAAPMGAQIQNQHVASTNRAQFANVNHGRPANAVVSRPLAADRNVRAPAAVQFRNQTGAQQQRQGAQQQQQRPQTPQQQQRQVVPQRQEYPQQQQRQAATQQQQRQAAPQRQAFPQQQQRQATPQQQQRQAAPQQQQRQATPQQQQRQAAPQQQQRQATPQQQQRQQSQPRQAAPQHQPNQEHPK